MKTLLCQLAAAVLVAAPGLAPAATVTVINQIVNTAVPDNDPRGLSVVQPYLGDSGIVSSVVVTFETIGGWNGDIYAYLEHAGAVSVLLNRPGRTAADPAGAASSGMLVRFEDGAAQDVHTALPAVFGQPASGTYQPDARAADPDLVTDASPRSKYLSAFNGQAPDGAWTLFVADLGAGDVAVLDNWTLIVTVVPEPSALLLGSLGLPLLWLRRRAAAKRP